MDQLYTDLMAFRERKHLESVHLADFPKSNSELSTRTWKRKWIWLRKFLLWYWLWRRKVNIKVRQPLQKIMIPILDKTTADKIEAIKKLILTEVNVKGFEYIKDTIGILVKKIKPNFKTLGPKYGKHMKGISAEIAKFSQQDIAALEQQGHWRLNIDGSEVELTLDDVEIMSEDIPGLLVATEGKLTVALDVTLTTELLQEGIARELINRIQNLRKDSGFDVTDKISIEIQKHKSIYEAIKNHENYIATQTLAKRIEWVDNFNDNEAKEIEFDDEIKTLLKLPGSNDLGLLTIIFTILDENLRLWQKRQGIQMLSWMNLNN